MNRAAARGWFPVPRDLVESGVWMKPLALQTLVLVLAKVNHKDHNRGGFEYPAGTWTTCRAEIADALTRVENRQLITPTIKQVRTALNQLKAAGLIETERVKRTGADPKDRIRADVGIRIIVKDSELRTGVKPDLGRPNGKDLGHIRRTREVLSREEHRGTEVLGEAPAPGSGSPSPGVQKERTPRSPDLDPVEEDALAASYDLPVEAIRWLATDWTFALNILRRGEPLDEPLRAAILNTAAKAQADQADDRRAAAN